MRCCVLLTGRKRSGKDTVGGYLLRHAGFEACLALADSVKRVARQVVLDAYGVDVPIEDFTRDGVKEEPIGALRLAGRALTPRWAAQWVGQSLGRDLIGDEVWIRALLGRVLSHERVVITDARYRNEIEFFRRELGARGYRVVVIKTVDTGFVRPADPADDHPSEREADTNPCDLELRRNTHLVSREDFECMIEEVVTDLRLRSGPPGSC